MADEFNKVVAAKQGSNAQALVAHVMSRVKPWRDHRKPHQTRWNEYYRNWRGFWSKQDSMRESERSRVIMPASSNAVEMTVAEMQEATFGSGSWFSLSDDFADQQNEDMYHIESLLREDLEANNVPGAINACYLNGGIYGTLIAKIVVETNPFNVYVEAINPNEFVIDPAARTINEAYGMAHELTRPVHLIHKKQTEGIYRKVPVHGTGGNRELSDTWSRKDVEADVEEDQHYVTLTEYHGLVPEKYLAKDALETPLESILAEEIKPVGEERLVEAIVTIADDSILLRATRNNLGDRAFVACQHELVPGKFYGRGVMEKGYNPQKALDAEHRMRIDAMAYRAAPMFVVNRSALGGRRSNINPRPGRIFDVVGGALQEVIQPVSMGQTDPSTFSQTNELERLVHVGTGAMDLSGVATDAAKSNTATGASIATNVFLKRARLVMANVERNFLRPLVEKCALRYILLDDRYPKQDVEFNVSGSQGLIAREMENQQLLQLIGLLPEGSQSRAAVVKTLVESSTHPNKNEIVQALAADNAPPSEEEQQMQQQQQQMQMQGMQLELQKLQVEIQKMQAEAEAKEADAELKEAQTVKTIEEAKAVDDKFIVEEERNELEERRLDQADRQLDIQEVQTLQNEKELQIKQKGD